jgi:hypothetical protein
MASAISLPIDIMVGLPSAASPVHHLWSGPRERVVYLPIARTESGKCNGEEMW